MNRQEQGAGREPDPRQATATTRSARGDDTPNVRHDVVDELLATIRRFESAARAIADNQELSIKARCKALLELMANARRRDGAAFLETAVWRGCRHFFEGGEQVPRDLIEAIRRLIRHGHDRCPECRRPLPSPADLDRWRRLGHELHRRSA